MYEVAQKFIQENYYTLLKYYKAKYHSFGFPRDVPVSFRAYAEDGFHEWCIMFIENAFYNERLKSEYYSVGQRRDWIPGFVSTLMRMHIHRFIYFLSRKNKALISLEAISLLYYEIESEVLDSVMIFPSPLKTLKFFLSDLEIRFLLFYKKYRDDHRKLTSALHLPTSRVNSIRERLFIKLRQLKDQIGNVIRYFILGHSVFLSSTYEDLKEHRKEALHTLHKLASNGMPLVIYAMEYLVAGPEHPGHKCLELVRCSDSYIGILGSRYGTIWQSRDMSFTEAEFREAEQTGTHLSIYMANQDHRCTLPKDDDVQKEVKLKKLESYIQSHYTVEWFDSPIDLSRLIAEQMAVLIWKRD